jgi:ADP-ribose pyrophosphatase YjhB (NUDIX family)
VTAPDPAAPLDWLAAARRLQAIAQTGLSFAESPFDRERYAEIHALGLRMLGALLDAPVEAMEAAFAAESGYATPKTDVRVVVFRGTDEVLMVREKLDGGRWSLPGGWADVGLSPFEVAVKELREETGLRGRAVRLLALFDKRMHDHPPQPWYVYKCFVRCEVTGGALLGDTDETTAARWVHRGEIDGLDLSVHRVTAGQLHTLFAFAEQPDRPTLCD